MKGKTELGCMMVARCAKLGFRHDAVEVFVLVGILADCVIELSNSQIGIMGLYSLEEETCMTFRNVAAPITQ
jgi:hypothetical protein